LGRGKKPAGPTLGNFWEQNFDVLKKNPSADKRGASPREVGAVPEKGGVSSPSTTFSKLKWKVRSSQNEASFQNKKKKNPLCVKNCFFSKSALGFKPARDVPRLMVGKETLGRKKRAWGEKKKSEEKKSEGGGRISF